MTAESESPTRRQRLRWGKTAFQVAILVAVAWGLWRTYQQAQGKLAGAGIQWQQLSVPWLALSGVFYFLGMVPCSLFWHRVVNAMRQPVPRFSAIRAFFISQLGKYVPGKIMVIVMRTAIVGRHGVSRTLTVASIFVETLTMMSIGAAVGAVLLPVAIGVNWPLLLFAIVAAAAVGAPTLPPVFQRLVKLTRLHRLHPEIDESLAGVDFRVVLPGWIAIAVGWLAMGLSLWAALRAIPGIARPPNMPGDLPLLTACVALSTVAGFASGLPGGLGPRELVVALLIQPQFGEVAALLGAVVHRLVMVATELIVAGVLWPISPADPPRPSST